MFNNVLSLTALALATIHFQPQVQPQESYILESLQQGQAKIIAHRGGSLEAFENSQTAFQQARDINVWGVQLAVQATKDQQLIAFNDQQVGRVLQADQNQQQWSINQFTLEEVPPYRETIVNELGEEYTQPNPQEEKPATLQQVLEIFKRSKQVLIIEDKFQGSSQEKWAMQMKLFKEVREAGLWSRTIWQTDYTSQQIEQAFEIPALTVQKDQEIEYAFQNFLSGDWQQNQQQFEIRGDVFKTPYAFETLKQAPQQFQQAVIFPQSFTQEQDVTIQQFYQYEEQRESEIQLMNASLKQSGKPVIYWTANQEQDFQKAIELGASAIITDRPAQAQVYMLSQQWSIERQQAQWQQWR